MNPAIAPVLLTALLLLAGCAPEAQVHSGNEVYIRPLSAAELLPLGLCCALTLALLTQAFIPPLRRFYRAAFCMMINSGNKARERAALLANYAARLLFCFGLCLLPLCLIIYGDTFSPHLDGPGIIHPLFVGLCLSGFLMVAS